MPSIQWFTEDGVEILTEDSRYDISYDLNTGTASLIIKHALISDEMSYKCVASNKYGTAKTIGVLVVKATKSKKSPSPGRSLTPPTLTTQRSISPLKNIDVPPSNLMPVKEETELSSSQSEDGKKGQKPTKSLVEPQLPSLEDTRIDGCKVIVEPPKKIEIREGEDIKICCNILGTEKKTKKSS